MANLDITIKRKNGASYDVLYPTTIVAQVEGLQTALDAKLNTSARGAANGVASLDGNSKIPVAQLPDRVFDNLEFVDTIEGATQNAQGGNLSTLASYVRNIYSSTVGMSAKYFVASTVCSLTSNPVTAVAGPYDPSIYFRTKFSTGDGTAPAGTSTVTTEDLEIGDWIIITNVYGAGTSSNPYEVWFAVVNNTYELATTAIDGIVRLSSSTSTATTGNAVVTNGILNGLLATANTNLNGTTNANKLAPAAHHHNSEYLGISANAVSASKWANARTITLGGDLTGSVSIDGSANVTLTAEVSNDSHTHSFDNITSKPTTLSGYGITDGVVANVAITGATKTKITYDTKGLVTAGADLVAADIPNLDTAKITTGTFAIARIPTGTTSSTVALGNHTHTFASLTSKPTTLSGYGITDAASTSDLTNRPEIYYNASANSDGDLVLDLDSDGAVA